MSGFGIRIGVNDAVVRAALAGLESRAADLTAPMDEIGAAMVASTLNRFETGTGPDGAPWVPSQRALAEGGQTLVDQGHLRGSMTHAAGPDQVTWGSNVVYAAIHQLGGRTGRGHAVELPARPFLGLDDADRDEIVAILRDHLSEGL